MMVSGTYYMAKKTWKIRNEKCTSSIWQLFPFPTFRQRMPWKLSKVRSQETVDFITLFFFNEIMHPYCRLDLLVLVVVTEVEQSEQVD